jgi:Na+/melibiose symporter-like transporter
MGSNLFASINWSNSSLFQQRNNILCICNLAIFNSVFLVFKKREKHILLLNYSINLWICSQLSFWKFTYDSPQNFLFYIPFVAGLFYGYVFYIDRIVYPKTKGLLQH